MSEPQQYEAFADAIVEAWTERFVATAEASAALALRSAEAVPSSSLLEGAAGVSVCTELEDSPFTRALIVADAAVHGALSALVAGQSAEEVAEAHANSAEVDAESSKAVMAGSLECLIQALGSCELGAAGEVGEVDSHESAATLESRLDCESCQRFAFVCTVGELELVFEAWLPLAGAGGSSLSGAVVVLHCDAAVSDGVEAALGRRVVAWTELEDIEALRGALALVVGWELARQSGLEIVETVRAHPGLGALRIALVHPGPTRSCVDLALRWGADALLAEPLQAAEIEARLLAEPSSTE